LGLFVQNSEAAMFSSGDKEILGHWPGPKTAPTSRAAKRPQDNKRAIAVAFWSMLLIGEQSSDQKTPGAHRSEGS